MGKNLLLAGIVACLTVALASCAAPVTRPTQANQAAVELEKRKQEEVALQSLIDRQRRLARLYQPLAVAGAEFCEETSGTIGIFPINQSVVPEDLQDAASRVYGVSNALQILEVMPDSPAEAAGFKAGDILLEANGVDLGTGRAALEQLHNQLDNSPIATFEVSRDTDNERLDVVPERACAYPAVVANDDAVNAYADGNKLIITKGMMRFANSDQELQLVLAHELAHNAMGHIDKKKTNYVLGSLVDILAAAYGINTQGAFGNAAANSYSVDFEKEADYVGLYIMARANISIDGAEYFWRRMAAEHPASIKSSPTATHPATPERFVSIRETKDEIAQKMDSDGALVPEMKH